MADIRSLFYAVPSFVLCQYKLVEIDIILNEKYNIKNVYQYFFLMI